MNDQQRQPRVFLIEENLRYDLSGLAPYGAVVFLNGDRAMNPFNTTHIPAQIRDGLRREEFDPAIDYVCMTGQNLKIAMFLAVAAHDYGPLRLLFFEASSETYVERVFDIHHQSSKRAAG
jgi:hypothetical protein